MSFTAKVYNSESHAPSCCHIPSTYFTPKRSIIPFFKSMLLVLVKIAGQLFLKCSSTWICLLFFSCRDSHCTFLAGMSQNRRGVLAATACELQDGAIKIFHPTCCFYSVLLTLLLSGVRSVSFSLDVWSCDVEQVTLCSFCVKL